VKDGFGSSVAPHALAGKLQYADDDGDLCTLTEVTLQDCLSFARSGVLRLRLNADGASIARDTDGRNRQSAAGCIIEETSQTIPLEPCHVSIATPPSSPRFLHQGIDDAYENEWSLVAALPLVAE